MLIPKFYNVREFVGASLDGAGFILVKNAYRAEVTHTKNLLADIQRLLKELQKSPLKPTGVYKELCLDKFDLSELEIYLAPSTETGKKQTLRTIKVYAEGGSLELPDPDNTFFEGLSDSDKKLVLTHREVQLLNTIDAVDGGPIKIHLYCITHPDEFGFIYFGSVLKDILNPADIKNSVSVYWKDSKRPGYTNQGIKAVFEKKSLEWYQQIKYTELGSIVVFDKEHRLAVFARLINIADKLGYTPVNKLTDKYDKIRLTNITMQGPIVDILLRENIDEYLFNE